jgi:hypothetical protein
MQNARGRTGAGVEVLDGDGKVTNADLQGLLNLLKSGGGSNAVPEPESAWLCLIGLLVGADGCQPTPKPFG